MKTHTAALTLTLSLITLGVTRLPAAELPDAGLINGSFEQTAPNAATLAANWQPFEAGYALDSTAHRTGARSIRCENATETEKRGALYRWELNQERAAPIDISGWSRADGVSGGADGDYSLYIDVEYNDGSFLYGLTAPFATGTHDWQVRRVRIVPAKPIRTLKVYALFRGHRGTVWFDDIAATAVRNPFYGQTIAPPTLPPGSVGGIWFARDVAANSPLLPLRAAQGTGNALAGERALGVHLVAGATGADGALWVALENRTDRPRAITLYYMERFGDVASTAPSMWWDDIRSRRPAVAPGEYVNLTPLPNTGATSAMSLYPWGCLTQGRRARMLAIPPDLGPRVARIGYHAGSRLYYVAFDVALPPRQQAASRPPVRVAVARADIDPAWSFRAATAEYYRRFPQAFVRRSKAEGIWMPFTNPAIVPRPAEFGFAYHEGDNSVASDDRLGILSFHYAEPMTYWQSLAPSVPRTYEAAMAKIRADAAAAGDSEAKRSAQALLLSGTRSAEGVFNVQFQNTPWANGAVWVLNPSPRLPHPAGQWTKARMNYPETEQARYRPGRGTEGLDGEYLDSLESWADTLDYRPESLAATTLPLTFATDTRQPALPTWFSVYEYTRYLSDDLHGRHKLLMANTVLARIWAFAPLLDVLGIETNWNPGGEWHPDSDTIFNFRRTLSHQKPYLLLQNTDFDRFGLAEGEKYFRDCLFYGVYPSMFSVDAANHPYWDNPQWYERDRPLFRRYIPVIRELSAAGWEPITRARSSVPGVYVERFGERYLTVRNTASAPAETVLTIDRAFAGKRSPDALTFVEALSGRAVRASAVGVSYRLPLSLGPDEVRVLRLALRP